MWVAMSAAEREGFLAGVHVGVLCTALGATGQTLAVPVWYSYEPGGLLTVLTGRRSRKAGAIRAAGRFGLCVQDDSPPYRYVSVEGPVVSEVDVETAAGLVVTSVITTRSVRELKLEVGREVVALVKSTEVSIATL